MKKTRSYSVKDTGCSLHPSCLDCPRRVCIEETPREAQRERTLTKQETARRLKSEGKRNYEIVEIMGISRRTAERYLRGVKQ